MTGFTPPATEDALARLSMPMAEAMRTQRAVRRLHTEPVDLKQICELLEYEQTGVVVASPPLPRPNRSGRPAATQVESEAASWSSLNVAARGQLRPW